MAGMYPHNTTVLSNTPYTIFGPPQLPQSLPTLGQSVHNASYATAHYGKWHLGDTHHHSCNPKAYGYEVFSPHHVRG